MNKENEYNPCIEFQTLRDELLQGKKYVFERPLLIITVSVALINFLDKSYSPFIPPVAIGLLMFNLWFTVNRMKSISRISAYIQVELKEKLFKPWLGWETSLRFYRKWIKLNQMRIKEILENKIDKDSVPDAIGYYPTIYYMHLIIVIIAILGSVIYLLQNTVLMFIVLSILSFMLFSLFCLFSFRWRPSVLRSLIEENRVIWIEVYSWLAEKGIKDRLSKNQ